jgi:hypothetical protein
MYKCDKIKEKRVINMKDWIRTNEYQWIKKIDDDRYEIVHVELYDDEYIVQEMFINIKDLKQDEIDEMIDGYFDSVDAIKIFRNDWKQALAELYPNICPINNEFDLRFEDEEELGGHLKDNYQINFEG